MLTITPSVTSWRIGDFAPTFTASGAAGSVSWSVNHGSLRVAASGLSATLQLSNKESFHGDDPVTVTADDGTTTATVSIDAYATFPYQPDWEFESSVDADIEISKAEDNSERGRVLSDLFYVLPLVFTKRSFDEGREVARFYAAHRQANKWFYVQDKGLEELIFMRFDSPLKRKPNGPDWIDYSFTGYAKNWDAPPDPYDYGDEPEV